MLQRRLQCVRGLVAPDWITSEGSVDLLQCSRAGSRDTLVFHCSGSVWVQDRGRGRGHRGGGY